MANNAQQPQPLQDKIKIVNEDGTPTQFFIRWSQLRQEAIAGGMTMEQFLTYLDGHQLDSTPDITLFPSGNLADSPLIGLSDTGVVPDTYGDATHVAQITVDAKGRITDVVEVAISGGGGGGGGPFAPWTVPVLADFTPLNAGSTTFTDNLNGIVFKNPAGMGFQTRGLIANAAPPAAPWNLYARMDTSLVAGEGNSRVGVTLQNAGGRLQQFGFRNDGNALHLLDIINWNSPSSYSGESSGGYYMSFATWIRLENDGTNINYYIGDGYNWIQVMTVTLAGWLGTVTGAGITLQSGNNSLFSFNSFSFTAPVAGGGSPQ